MSDGCPHQAVFGPDDITDCTFPRDHTGDHSWEGVQSAPPPDTAIRDKLAIALHDNECGDTHCSPIAMGAYYRQADTALAVVVPLVREDATRTERERIRAVIDRGKIEWLIHTLDLIDQLAESRGMDTSTEVQDDLRKLADLLDGDLCYCAETSTRNCPRHGNGDHG